MSKTINLHLISDSTGGTLNGIVKASLAQFADINAEEHLWNLVRTERQIDLFIQSAKENPGPVLFTMVDEDMAQYLHQRCQEINVPCIAVLQPIIGELGKYLGMKSSSTPGLQHILDEKYFDRIDAMDYALHHDDGQGSGRGLSEADVILLGVSRTSKTPTCIYLANRGIKAANIPVVPNIKLPEEVFSLKTPLFVGLTESPTRLIEIRASRLNQLGQKQKTDYLDPDQVKKEVAMARQLYTRMSWPVIDVTRRSVEETAAEILTLLSRRKNISSVEI